MVQAQKKTIRKQASKVAITRPPASLQQEVNTPASDDLGNSSRKRRGQPGSGSIGWHLLENSPPRYPQGRHAIRPKEARSVDHSPSRDA